ncbi:MAG: methylated-DNA--[protein]-cysteine S-methyltransferase [Clostridiales bacterium]|nr:methylated-DNA--[protein]-cysteine S-methyltransferase [Candidatus Blautia equi]
MKQKSFVQFMDSPVGKLRILQRGEAIAQLLRCSDIPEGACVEETPLLLQAKAQLQEYFDGVRRDFDLPLAPEGTPFQRKAWDTLCGIPYGETISYGEEAERMQCKCARAVGQANGRNPICIVIPCHRVIRGDGSIGGYSAGLDMKGYLLELEKRVIAEDK